jgi:hypothetical protein
MASRSDLLSDLVVSQATRSCERKTAKDIIKRERRKTVKVKKPACAE